VPREEERRKFAARIGVAERDFRAAVTRRKRDRHDTFACGKTSEVILRSWENDLGGHLVN
jgi:hypothetical protein